MGNEFKLYRERRVSREGGDGWRWRGRDDVYLGGSLWQYAGYPNERPDAAYMFFAGSILLQRNLTKLPTRAPKQWHARHREKRFEMANRETTNGISSSFSQSREKLKKLPRTPRGKSCSIYFSHKKRAYYLRLAPRKMFRVQNIIYKKKNR